MAADPKEMSAAQVKTLTDMLAGAEWESGNGLLESVEADGFDVSAHREVFLQSQGQAVDGDVTPLSPEMGPDFDPTQPALPADDPGSWDRELALADANPPEAAASEAPAAAVLTPDAPPGAAAPTDPDADPDLDAIRARLRAAAVGGETAGRERDADRKPLLPAAGPSDIEAFARGGHQGLTSGTSEEMLGAGAALASKPGAEQGLRSLFGMESVQHPRVAKRGDWNAMSPEAAQTAAYEGPRDRERVENRAAQEAHPGPYMAGEIGGGLVQALALRGLPGLPGLSGPVGAAFAQLPWAKRVVAAAKAGIGPGALEGLIGGAGRSEAGTVGGVAADAGLGGLLGATLGAVVPAALEGAIMPTVRAAGKGIKNFMTDELVRPDIRRAVAAIEDPAVGGRLDVSRRAGLNPGEEVDELLARSRAADMSAAELGASEAIESAKTAINRRTASFLDAQEAALAREYATPAAQREVSTESLLLDAVDVLKGEMSGGLPVPGGKHKAVEELIDRFLRKADAPEDAVGTAAEQARGLEPGKWMSLPMDGKKLDKLIKDLGDMAGDSTPGSRGLERRFAPLLAKARELRERAFPRLHQRAAQSHAENNVLQGSLRKLGLPEQGPMLAAHEQQIYAALSGFKKKGGPVTDEALLYLLKDSPELLKRVKIVRAARETEALHRSLTAEAGQSRILAVGPTRKEMAKGALRLGGLEHIGPGPARSAAAASGVVAAGEVTGHSREMAEMGEDVRLLREMIDSQPKAKEAR